MKNMRNVAQNLDLVLEFDAVGETDAQIVKCECQVT